MRENRQNMFINLVENKYHLYNSLFTKLPFSKMKDVGTLLPLLDNFVRKELEKSANPLDIINHFFVKYTDIRDEKDIVDFLFIIIQFIERQVVLFDSIEDSAFSEIYPESKKGRFASLQNLGLQHMKMSQIKDKLKNFTVRIVFTAHPTQFYPNEVQLLIEDLRREIAQDSVSSIVNLLRQLGRTSFIKKKKPSPLDEALSIIYYMRNVYYEAVLTLNGKLKKYFFNNSEKLPSNLIQLGFWPGGDRDGNPFVTAEVTIQVLHELRKAILKCYYHHLKQIRRRITFVGVVEILEELSNHIYQNMFSDTCQLSQDIILKYINKAKEELFINHGNLFHELLEELELQVQIFGLHFASLDIRQDSRVHKEVLDDLFSSICPSKKLYSMWDIEEKLEYLEKDNIVNVNLQLFENSITKDTILNLQQIRKLIKINGEKSVSRYIVSNTNNYHDIIHVLQLFELAGWKHEKIKFDIVPLFETMKGMHNAEKTMRFLYKNHIYSKHLKRRENKQTIMLGFSDGTKDGGYISANWEIFRTKEIMTSLANSFNLKVIFFDGRGGPPARGGGKTHQFYSSQGSGIANDEIHLTIQGQTITSNFGTVEQSIYSFEQLITAGVLNSCFKNSDSELTEKERELLKQLSKISNKKYKELKENKLFVPYLEEVSTLKYYTRTNISSRPSKRGKDSKFSFKKLRAIPFVGAWSQLKQNVPGFYGFGTAIQYFKDKGRLSEIKDLYNHSLFFKSLLLNSMMSMEKTYFPLTSYLKKDKKFSEFWNMLHDEFLLTKKNMLEITGFYELMEQEPISKKSIDIRENIVLPLLCIQQYALEKIKCKNQFKDIYEKMVTRSLFGNINASRNSA